MPLRCRHAIKKPLSLYDQDKLRKNEPIHLTNSALISEPQFESWAPVKAREQRQSSAGHPSLHRIPPSPSTKDTSYFTRNYGWNEIEENEDETKRLRQLLSIWDAERIAILKLQHDLDKNILQRTCDYIKRVGQSVGLALWLWVHRPANCSHIHQGINGDRSQQFINVPYSDRGNPSKFNDQTRPDCSIPSIDSLPDSLWLKHFVLDETKECLPPIARAMKNLVDHNALIWNSRNEEENLWPHFINQSRETKSQISLRNIFEKKDHSSPPKSESNKTIPKIKLTNLDTKDRLSPKKPNTSRRKHKKSSKRKRSKSRSRRSSHRSKSKKKRIR